MQIGVCTGPENAAILEQAGFDYIEANVQAFLKPRDHDEAFDESRRAAEGCPLPIRAANGFVPGDLKSTGEQFDPDGIARYAEVAFRRANQVGIEHIVFGSGGSRGLDEGFAPEKANEQFVELNRKLGPIAGEFGVVIVIEPLRRAECNFINTITDGAAIVQQVDHPNVQLLADIYHMTQNGETPSSLKAFGSIIQHTHVAENAGRTAPGVEGDDFRPYFQALAEVGYTGRMSVEGSWPDGMEALAAGAAQTLRQQMADVNLD